MSLRIGLLGYFSLRTDQMQPIDAPQQYFRLVKDLTALNGGEHLHWLQLKHLSDDCHLPIAASEPDEVEALSSVVHYGNCLAPLGRYVNDLPSKGRLQALNDLHFDWNSLKYRLPQLDVVIVESTGQMGAAYFLDATLRRLYQLNPNIGFVLMDCDMTASGVLSKIRRWHPNANGRCVLATYHPTRKKGINQVVAIKQHLDYRTQTPVLDRNDVCYVGNDYKRREPMERFFVGPRVHHYGRVKKDFAPTLAALGANIHGPYEVTEGRPLEQAYRDHGIGLQISRDEYYRLGFITPRMSEIARAGCLMLVDHKLRIAKPIVGEWCLVKDAADMVAKADVAAQYPDFWAETIAYQRQMLNHYMAPERHADALWTACRMLTEYSDLQGLWYCPFDDLVQASKA